MGAMHRNEGIGLAGRVAAALLLATVAGCWGLAVPSTVSVLAEDLASDAAAMGACGMVAVGLLVVASVGAAALGFRLSHRWGTGKPLAVVGGVFGCVLVPLVGVCAELGDVTGTAVALAGSFASLAACAAPALVALAGGVAARGRALGTLAACASAVAGLASAALAGPAGLAAVVVAGVLLFLATAAFDAVPEEPDGRVASRGVDVRAA